MRRIPLAAIAIALAGCPLPQPLPTYPAGTVTPPRILSASASGGAQSLIPVPAGCATPPTYVLDAQIFYQESVTVEARWFVDYRKDIASRYNYQTRSEVPPDPDALILKRQVPQYEFKPYDFAPGTELGISAGPWPWSASGIVHVVELVVSNGFDASTNPLPPEPNRTPATTADGASQFEIQTYRWIFVNVPEDPTATCTAGALGCPKCLP